MNKKILAVAVASAVAAPMAASADSSLTVYGGTGIAIESIDYDDTDALAVNSNHSAIGFEGSTDVSSDLAAVFHWDAFVALDGSGNATNDLIGGGRDGWAGLRGSFGTVALGFQGRPWKTLSHALDPFEGTIADYSSVLGRVPFDSSSDAVYFDGGIGNSIIWFGPNVNGFTWHVQYGAEDTDGGANNFGLQGNYSNDQFFIGLSYDMDEDTGTGAGRDDASALKLVGSVNFNGVTITGAYEQLDGIGFVSDADRDAFWLAGTIPVGHGSVRAAVTLADEVADIDETDATQFSLGYFGNLSDNATWYAIYTQISNGDAANYGFTPQPHTSSHSLGGTTGALGNDASAISLGIKYNFAADLI